MTGKAIAFVTGAATGVSRGARFSRVPLVGAAHAFELYFEQEREDEAELWELIRAEMYRDGLAAAGASEVLAAAQAGRVGALRW